MNPSGVLVRQIRSCPCSVRRTPSIDAGCTSSVCAVRLGRCVRCTRLFVQRTQKENAHDEPARDRDERPREVVPGRAVLAGVDLAVGQRQHHRAARAERGRQDHLGPDPVHIDPGRPRPGSGGRLRRRHSAPRRAPADQPDRAVCRGRRPADRGREPPDDGPVCWRLRGQYRGSSGRPICWSGSTWPERRSGGSAPSPAGCGADSTSPSAWSVRPRSSSLTSRPPASTCRAGRRCGRSSPNSPPDPA